MHDNREAWLNAAVEKLWPLFDEVAPGPRPRVLVSTGWPSKKGTASGRRSIGQCWSRKASVDGETNHIFISPMLGSEVDALETLIHELIHAQDDCEHQHKGPFVRLMRGVGLEGKPTATVAGEQLRAKLGEIAEELGEYPHKALTPNAEIKKQSTRMIKLVCHDCTDDDGKPYTVRTTRKWIEYGLPKCPNDHDLEEE